MDKIYFTFPIDFLGYLQPQRYRSPRSAGCARSSPATLAVIKYFWQTNHQNLPCELIQKGWGELPVLSPPPTLAAIPAFGPLLPLGTAAVSPGWGGGSGGDLSAAIPHPTETLR